MTPTSPTPLTSPRPSAPAVRLARPNEVDSLAALLADAFDDDPIMRFIVPHDSRYADRLARLFRIEVAAMMKLGATWVAVDGDRPIGVATWAPPGRWKQSTGDMIRYLVPVLRVFGTSIRRAIAVFGAVENAHPMTPPHWYLSTIGTAPAHQGRGVGRLLLDTMLERGDHEGVPAFLESSKPENVPYYERFGFVARDGFDLPGGGPSVIPMWREPAPHR